MKDRPQYAGYQPLPDKKILLNIGWDFYYSAKVLSTQLQNSALGTEYGKRISVETR
ncbi:hypothetical protein [Nostoc sp. NMS8]|uniref:hypothetical protein n=1 Tax=Nostoc sp. NMS8 TaxID=2815392 RepID=UPI0025CC4294|nr:hypothetical protein [Nostoc sp. NMS8]MBN3959750.1 hypothetical protein [Nostoc sp. NMS8]